jgi:hypothetical protein
VITLVTLLAHKQEPTVGTHVAHVGVHVSVAVFFVFVLLAVGAAVAVVDEFLDVLVVVFFVVVVVVAFLSLLLAF